MALHLYRRHRLNCEGGHAEDSCSSELDERRKGWKRCACLIHLSGTLGGKFRRRTTDKATWDDARAYVTALEAAGCWETTAAAPAPIQALAPEPPRTPDGKPIPSRMAIVQACKLFRDSRESAGLEPATLGKYRTFTKQITAYAESRGYVMIDQFTNVDIDLFWGNLVHARRASASPPCAASSVSASIGSGSRSRLSVLISSRRKGRAKRRTRPRSRTRNSPASSERATSRHAR